MRRASTFLRISQSGAAKKQNENKTPDSSRLLLVFQRSLEGKRWIHEGRPEESVFLRTSAVVSLLFCHHLPSSYPEVFFRPFFRSGGHRGSRLKPRPRTSQPAAVTLCAPPPSSLTSAGRLLFFLPLHSLLRPRASDLLHFKTLRSVSGRERRTQPVCPLQLCFGACVGPDLTAASISFSRRLITLASPLPLFCRASGLHM